MTTTPPDPDQPTGATPPPYPGQQPPSAPFGADPYPTHPGTPPAQGGPAPEKPSSIGLAVKLMLLGAAISAVSWLLSLATVGSLKDDIAEQLRDNDPSVTQSTIDAAYALGIVFAIVIGLLQTLLWVWMAWKNGQGRSWARVVATVLGGLNVVFTLLNFTTAGVEPIGLVFSLVNLVLAVVILALLWRPTSTQYYDAVTRSRQLR